MPTIYMQGKPEAGDMMTSDKIVDAMREIWRLKRGSRDWYHNGPVVGGVVHNVVKIHYIDTDPDGDGVNNPASEYNHYIEHYIVKREAGSGDVTGVAHITQATMENLYGYIVDESEAFTPASGEDAMTKAQIVQKQLELHCMCDGSAIYLTYLYTTRNAANVPHFKLIKISMDGEYQDTLDISGLSFPPVSEPDNWWGYQAIESETVWFRHSGFNEHIWLSGGYFYTYGSSVNIEELISVSGYVHAGPVQDFDPNVGSTRGAIVRFDTSGSGLELVEYEYYVLHDGDGDGEYFGINDRKTHYSIGQLGQAADGTMIMRRSYSYKEPLGDGYTIKGATAYGPMSLPQEGDIFESYTALASATSSAWYVYKTGDTGPMSVSFSGGVGTLWVYTKNSRDGRTYAVYDRTPGATLKYTMNADALELFDSPYESAPGTPDFLIGSWIGSYAPIDTTSSVTLYSSIYDIPSDRGPLVRLTGGDPSSSVPPDKYDTPDDSESLYNATLYDPVLGEDISQLECYSHNPPFSETRAMQYYRGVFEATINDTVVDSGETVSGNVIIAHVLTRGDGTLLIPTASLVSVLRFGPMYIWPEDDFHVYRVFLSPEDGSILGYIHTGASKIYPFKAYRSNGDSVPIWQGLLDNGGTLDEMETPSYALTWEHSQDAPSGDYPDVAFPDGSNMVVKLITDMRAALENTTGANYIAFDAGPPITMRLVSADDPLFEWAKTEQQLIDQGYCSVDEIGEIYDAINATTDLFECEGGAQFP